MRKPRIFISHSTSPENEPFLDQVYAALEQHDGGNSFDVFLDRKEITTGEEWHQKILKNLCTCDAVVILLSEKALASHWVRQEAAFSAMRRYGDPSLKLVVVTLDDVDAKTIEACPYLGNVARLHDVQFAPKNKTPDDIVAELAGLTARAYSPLDKDLQSISLTLACINSTILEHAVQILESYCITKLPWHSNPARTLALYVAIEQQKALEQLYRLLEVIRNATNRRAIAENLLEVVKPLWVRPKAAENLSLAQQKRIPLIINGTNPANFTAMSYAERTWGIGKYKLVEVGHCRNIEEIENIILATIGSKIASIKTPQDIANSRLNSKLRTVPILLVFPSPESGESEQFLPDEYLLESLLSKYPTTAILIPTGENLPDYRPDLQPLKPNLDVEEEERQYNAYLDVFEYIVDTM